MRSRTPPPHGTDPSPPGASSAATGDAMTGAQRRYLAVLAAEAGVPLDDGLTRAEAARRIDELLQLATRAAS